MVFCTSSALHDFSHCFRFHHLVQLQSRPERQRSKASRFEAIRHAVRILSFSVISSRYILVYRGKIQWRVKNSGNGAVEFGIAPEDQIETDNYLHRNTDNVNVLCVRVFRCVKNRIQGFRSTSTAGSSLKSAISIQNQWIEIVFDYAGLF